MPGPGDNKINVEIKAVTAGFASALAPVNEQIKKLREGVEAFTGPIVETIGQLKKLGEAFLVFEALDKVEAFIEKLEDMATSALKLSAVLGTSIEKVSEFQGVLIAVGGNAASGTVRTMQHLQRMMSEAMADPASHAAQAFKNLGISLTDVKAKGNDFNGMMEIMRGAFQSHQQGANMTANFYAILGRSFDTLVPVLRLTNEEFGKSQANFKKTESNIGPFAERLFTSGEKLRTFEQALTGVSLQVYSIFQPAMDGIIERLTDLTEYVQRAAVALGVFVATNADLRDLAHTFDLFGESAARFAKVIDDLIPALKVPEWLKFNGVLADLNRTLEATAKEFSGVTAAIESTVAMAERNAMKMIANATLGREITALERRDAELAAQNERIQGDTNLARREENTIKILKLMEDNRAKLAVVRETLGQQLADIEAKWMARSEGAWEAHTDRVANIISSTSQKVKDADPAESAGLAAALDPKNYPTSNKPVAPLGGRTGSGGKDIKNYMQEWRDALQKIEVDNLQFFGTTKQTELAYWSEKQAYVKSNMASITGVYRAEGASQVEADKRYKALNFALDSQLFSLRKGLASEWLAEVKKGLDNDLANLKTQLSQKSISESDWYERSRELQLKWLELLKSTQQQGTVVWKTAMEAWETLNKEHVKNIADQWNTTIDWITGKIDTMINGMLSGTQTMTQIIQNLFRNMATSVLAEIAKMMVRWTAFQAATATFGTGSSVAKAIGNPFSSMLSAAGSMFGSGGGTAAAQDKLYSAIVGQTAATVSNTGGITNWIGTQLQSLAQFLGLTTATTASTTATGTAATVTSGGLIPALVALTTAVAANTAAQGAGGAGGGLGGLLGGAGGVAGAAGGGGFDFSQVLGSGAFALAAFATGAFRIPRTMAAMIHKDEMVVPAPQAAVLRASMQGLSVPSFASGAPTGAPPASGSGTNVTFNVNAIDSRDVITMLRQHGPAIAEVFKGQMRQGSDSIRTLVPGVR